MSNDYLRNVTEQVVSYMDLPVNERRKRREEQRVKKQQIQTTSSKWFGVLPLAIKMSLKNKMSNRS